MARIKRGKSSIDIECRTASEFLQILDPATGCFADGYIFRGVSSAAFKLLPSAHRSDAVLAREYAFRVGPARSHHEQATAELFTIRRFFDIAAREGIRLPEDSYLLRSSLETWRLRFTWNFRQFMPYDWPPPEFYSLIGLAQHYGLPTRALDWTRSSNVAAYFAARSADNSKNDHLVVWAFNEFAHEVDQVADDDSAPRPLIVYTASGADNDNLRAQRGLFMLHLQHVKNPTSVFKPRTYNGLILGKVRSIAPAMIMTRVSLPTKEARKLLVLLADVGTTAAALFPGLWGVAREYQEQHVLYGIQATMPSTPQVARVKDRFYKVIQKL